MKLPVNPTIVAVKISCMKRHNRRMKTRMPDWPATEGMTPAMLSCVIELVECGSMAVTL